MFINLNNATSPILNDGLSLRMNERSARKSLFNKQSLQNILAEIVFQQLDVFLLVSMGVFIVDRV